MQSNDQIKDFDEGNCFRACQTFACIILCTKRKLSGLRRIELYVGVMSIIFKFSLAYMF